MGSKLIPDHGYLKALIYTLLEPLSRGLCVAYWPWCWVCVERSEKHQRENSWQTATCLLWTSYKQEENLPVLLVVLTRPPSVCVCVCLICSQKNNVYSADKKVPPHADGHLSFILHSVILSITLDKPLVFLQFDLVAIFKFLMTSQSTLHK